MFFYRNGHKKKRPGVYKKAGIRNDVLTPTWPELEPSEPLVEDEIMAYCDEAGNVTISAPSCVVNQDGTGNVLISRLTASVKHDANGKVTIGG